MNHHHGLSSGVKGQGQGWGSSQIQIPPGQHLPCPLRLLKVLHGTTEQENANTLVLAACIMVVVWVS